MTGGEPSLRRSTETRPSLARERRGRDPRGNGRDDPRAGRSRDTWLAGGKGDRRTERERERQI